MKRFIAVLFLTLVIMSLFTGCSKLYNEDNEQIEEGMVKYCIEGYEFRASKHENFYVVYELTTTEYLALLDHLDEEQYEIVDISKNRYFYDVTFRVK